MNPLESSDCSSNSTSNCLILSSPLMTSTQATLSNSFSSTLETAKQIIHISSAVLIKDLEIGMVNIFVIDFFLLVPCLFIRT